MTIGRERSWGETDIVRVPSPCQNSKPSAPSANQDDCDSDPDSAGCNPKNSAGKYINPCPRHRLLHSSLPPPFLPPSLIHIHIRQHHAIPAGLRRKGRGDLHHLQWCSFRRPLRRTEDRHDRPSSPARCVQALIICQTHSHISISDFHHIDLLAHFDRERIPERVVRTLFRFLASRLPFPHHYIGASIVPLRFTRRASVPTGTLKPPTTSPTSHAPLSSRRSALAQGPPCVSLPSVASPARQTPPVTPVGSPSRSGLMRVTSTGCSTTLPSSSSVTLVRIPVLVAVGSVRR